MLLNVEELCERTGRSRRTVLRWRDRGAPFYRVGWRLYAEPGALDVWLACRGPWGSASGRRRHA